MIATIRFITAALLFLIAGFCVVTLPNLDGPQMPAFLGFMILPAVAAVLVAPRTSRCAFVAAALYAVLAGARRFVAPDGNSTSAQQLCTAAMFVMLLPVLDQIRAWIARPRTRQPR